jgi:hypothetical protein
MILNALKKRLYRENDKAPGKWLKELSAMVWDCKPNPIATLEPPHTSWSMAQKQ